MNRMFASVFLLVGLLPTGTFSGMQDRPPVARDTCESADENENLSDPLTRELARLAAEFPDTRLEKRFYSKGVQRYLLSHHDRPLKISVFEKGNLQVRWTRAFSSDDLDELADCHPDLLKHVLAFPETSQDHARVKLKLETEITLDLASEREFAARHPGLCRIYRGFRDLPAGPDRG